MYDNEKQESNISYEHKKFAKCGNSLQQQQQKIIVINVNVNL